MNNLQNQIMDLKKELKLWEKEFEKQSGKKPSVKDIDAQPSIRERYKLLKSLTKTKQEEERKENISKNKKTNRFRKQLSVTPKKVQPAEEVLAGTPGFEVSVFGPHLNKKNQKQPLINGDTVDDFIVPFEESIKSLKQEKTTRKSPEENPLGIPQETKLRPMEEEFSSPKLRAGYFLNAEDQSSNIFTPSKAVLLKTPTLSAKKSETGDQGTPVKQPTIMSIMGDSPQREINNKKVKKRPINGKRQTSKKKLQPVSVSEDFQTDKPNKWRKRKSDAGPVLKINRRGKRFKSINHAIALKNGPVNNNTEEIQRENPFEVVDQFFSDGSLSDLPEIDSDHDEPIENNSKNLLNILQSIFGYTSFRPGQLETINNILDGRSTLLVLNTGAGKSLCYQVPAYIIGREDEKLNILISPTVSLMEDQMRTLNPKVRGAMLHSHQTASERNKNMKILEDRQVDMLIITPEKLFNRQFLQFLSSFPIGFVCIDEAHCLSEWSHAFRSSYLHIVALLTTQLHVSTFLCLTATATSKVRRSICNMVNIDKENVIHVRNKDDAKFNITVSINTKQHKFQELLGLLQSERFSKGQIIIYCLRQKDTEELAQRLKLNMNTTIAAYHSGLSSSVRKQVQKTFMQGRMRIICATIAFGLGINKSDIRGIIHYTLPRSVENFIQEIGRGGRDGLGCECHVFVEDSDYLELRSLSCSNYLEPSVTKRFLNLLRSKSLMDACFEYSDCLFQYRQLCCVDFDKAQKMLNCGNQTMLSTVAFEFQNLTPGTKIFPNVFLEHEIIIHSGDADVGGMKEFLDSIESSCIKQGQSVLVDSQKACNLLKLSPYELHDAIEAKWSPRVTIKHHRPSLAVALTLDFFEMSAENIVELSRKLHNSVQEITLDLMNKVDEIYRILSIDSPSTLFEAVEEYFEMEAKEIIQPPQIVLKFIEQFKKILSADIRAFIDEYSNCFNSPVAIAKIFHGIPTLKNQAQDWYRSGYWRKYPKFDFVTMVDLIKEALERNILHE